GERSKIERVLGLKSAAPLLHKTLPTPPARTISAQENSALMQATIKYLQELFAKVTKIAANEVDSAKTFEDYGLDSIMILQFNQEISKDIKQLRKTLLFEYRTLAAL